MCTHAARTFTVGLNYRTENNNNGATLIMGRADLSLVERGEKKKKNSKCCEQEKKGCDWRRRTVLAVEVECVPTLCKKKKKKVSGCSSILNDAAKKEPERRRELESKVWDSSESIS